MDALTGPLIFTAVVFCPWALGGTVPRAIWTVNILCYLIGLLQLGLWVGCRISGFVPRVWPVEAKSASLDKSFRRARVALFFLLLTLLVWTLVAALNYRAVFHQEGFQFDYAEAITWLPHTYHRGGTWQAFGTYLAFTCFFYGVQFWITGLSAKERRRELKPDALTQHHLPDRLKWLCLVMVVNASLIAFEGILQRASGTHKVLWLYRSMGWNSDQFGPWAYRGNAAQFFNLIWPLGALLLWVFRTEWNARQESSASRGSGAYVVLVPLLVILVIAPFVAGSRAGIILAVIGWIVMAFLVRTNIHLKLRHLALAGGCIAVAAGISLAIAGQGNLGRFTGLMKPSQDGSSNVRVSQYKNTARLIREYPVLGVGPGAYQAVYVLYIGPGDIWYPYAHSDWLQVVAEFGVVGGILVGTMFLVYLVVVYTSGANAVLVRNSLLLGLGLTVAYATMDFPFLIHSVFLQYVTIGAIAISLPSGRSVRRTMD